MGGKAHGGKPMTNDEAEELYLCVEPFLLSCCDVVSRAGSLRRMKPTCGDLDIVAVPRKLIGLENTESMISLVKNEMYEKLVRSKKYQPTELDFWLTKQFGFQTTGKPGHAGLIDGRQVEVYVSEAADFGSQLQMWTGSMEHNVSLRRAAMKFGYSNSQYGLKKTDGTHLRFRTEVELYDALGMSWPAPENR